MLKNLDAFEETLDETVSTLLGWQTTAESYEGREICIQGMEEVISSLLTQELSTELARKKGVSYFVDLFKTYESWEVFPVETITKTQSFPIKYLLRLMRYRKWEEDLQQTNLLSYLVRNMDKVNT